MSRVKLLNVVTPQGHSGELSKGFQFSFAYASAEGGTRGFTGHAL